MGPFICDQTSDIFLLGVLVCWVASIENINKQKNETVDSIMIITKIDVCQYLSVFVYLLFM